MKSKIYTALFATSMAAFALAQNLPVKEILGQQYYVYKVKKGDSVYGITHRFGWDETEFVRLNPTISDGLKKNEIVYYPTGNVTVVEVEPSQPAPAPPADLPVLNHEVKRGETVYSIAKMYDIPISVIYDAHPSARNGIKAGEVISIDQEKAGFGNPEKIPFFYIIVKPGDTLYSTAKSFGLSVEDLLSANPGVSDRTFRAGSTLKIPSTNREPKVKRTMVESQTVGSLSSYKVDKNDTWGSISRKTGVSVEDLKEANENVRKLKKNEVLAVPVIETVSVEKEVPFTDPREENAEGRREIYDSIHHIDTGDDIRDVRIALMLDDPNARRDVEFSRGFLLALKQLGNPGYKVDLKIMAANLPVEDVVDSLELFNPQVVFTLSDKGAAEWLLSYGSRTGTEAINVFDAKSDVYTSSPSVIQLLTPSTYFNEMIAKAVSDKYGSRKLVTVTKGMNSDAMADAIAAAFPSGESKRIQLENFNPSLLPSASELLVVADVTDKADVEKLLAGIAEAKTENPLLTVTVIGRPNWVTFADPLAEQLYDNDVIIPSRFYFNPESEAGKTFISDYTALFDRGPLKSYPNYAATGYDSANWFIPALALSEGDFNVTVPKTELLQMPIELHRISNWGGFYNGGALLIHYTPWRVVETETLSCN